MSNARVEIIDLTEDGCEDSDSAPDPPNPRVRNRQVCRDNVADIIEITIDDSIPQDIIFSPISTQAHSTRVSRQIPPTPRRRIPSPPPNELKCPICIETYVNIKKNGLKIVVTRCGHMFCDFCLKKAISENGRKCPKCRKNVPKGATGIIEIFDVA